MGQQESTQIEPAQIEHAVRHYILENLMFSDDISKLPLDMSLLGSGTVDSNAVLEIVMFLEECYGVEIKDSQMLPENFDSVAKISSFVQRLLAAQ